MAFIHFFHLLALFLTLASGKPILISRLGPTSPQDGASTTFDVTLQSLGNTTVKAQVTNVTPESLRLVKRGGILDPLPTRKVIVNGTGSESDPSFIGATISFIHSHLSSDAFIELAPQQTVETTFDVHEFYDLSPGQQYSAVSEGHLEYTTVDNKKKVIHYHYKSNSISIETPTSIVRRLEERSTLVSCTDEYKTIVLSALDRAADMAKVAAADARTGSALFKKFFMSTKQADMDEVADRLEAVAKEATATGKLQYYCQPTSQDYCGSNIAAITYPSESRVVNCPGYYESPATNDYCNYLDQAAISLHEFTHATAVYNPGTDDIAYGYDAVLSLDTDKAKNNADSYAYYASAVFLNCAADDSVIIGTPTTDIPGDTGTTGTTTSTTTSTATSTTTSTSTSTITSTVTGTTTGTATKNPVPTPTEDNTPGSDWPWGHGSDDGPTSTESGGWGDIWGNPPSQATATPTGTSGGITSIGGSGGTSDFQKFMAWLINRLRHRYGQGKGQESGLQAAQEPPCDD